MDRAIFMIYAMHSTFIKWTLGVDFSQHFCSATFIEIALSNVAIRQCPAFALQKGAKKFDDRAKGQKYCMRNPPQVYINHVFFLEVVVWSEREKNTI